MFTTGETPVPGFDDLNVISNVGRTTPPRSTFHVDTSYVRIPPAYTALRAVEVPESGGQTLFSNQYRAYDTLPEDMRLDLADRTVEHVVTGLDLGDDDETSAVHPLFRVHPVTGRTALFLTTPKRCASVKWDVLGAGRGVGALAVRALDPRGQRDPARLGARGCRHVGQPVRHAPGGPLGRRGRSGHAPGMVADVA